MGASILSQSLARNVGCPRLSTTNYVELLAAMPHALTERLG